MRRGAKRAKPRTTASRPISGRSRKGEDSSDRQLQKRLDEALQREAATAEILKMISSSPANLGPVFDAVLARATRLCEAHLGVLQMREGDSYRAVAEQGATPEFKAWLFEGPRRLDRATGVGRALLEGRVVHIADITDDPAYRDRHPARVATVELGGARTFLTVPMLRAGEAIGTIVIYRPEVRPFTDKQIELVTTFADQAVIAVENVRLFTELQARNRDLGETLERQTATAEILRTISSSPTDVQPVFDAIATRALRLCAGRFSTVHRFDGEFLHLVAHTNFNADALAIIQAASPRRPHEVSHIGRAVRERSAVNLADVAGTGDAPPSSHRHVARLAGYRGFLAVPMIRDDQVVGCIALGREAAEPFPEEQVQLIKTFADQAVIAIENVRLFTELQGKNRALTQAHAQVTEALDQQTATSEILRVIASSPTDVQPVFDTIVRSAVLLCGAMYGTAVRFDGELMHLAAGYNYTPEAAQVLHEAFPMRPSPLMMSGRAILSGGVVQVEDAFEDPDYSQEVARAGGFRSMLAAPMLRDGRPIGAIVVNRGRPGRFSPTQIGLLQTFADQAVIAIENVRLFKELEARNRDLRVALEQQTATSEVLKVIGRSTFDLHPVFETLAENAVRLCEAERAFIFRFDGEVLRVAATHNVSPARREFAERNPIRPGRHSAGGRAALERHTIHIHDIQADPEYTYQVAQSDPDPTRTLLSIPMLRGDELLGVITIFRHEVRPFSDSHIALMETFADQAVIAIENVRLFKELEARTQDLTRSVGELRALSEVGQAISSTLNLDTVLATIVSRAIELSGTDAGTIWEFDQTEEQFHLRAARNLEDDIVGVLRATPLRRGEGTVGRLADTRAPIQVADISEEVTAYRGRLEVIVRSGYRAILSVPLLREDQLIGALTVNAKTAREFPPMVVELLTTFATQSALAIQNARLFREIADKSRQLEVASQHKSEFLANMSHELRTPLNAIIGFSEVLSERMFGELNEKQEEYLKDIHDSGQHLLSLINDILDLSKIEAGRMELELKDFDFPQAIGNAVTLVRERAGRRGIALHQAVDQRLGQVRGDERKVKQVLLNLLSNALKFTPEGGRVDVRATVVDGMAEVSVTDTGVGIALEDQERVFEEFRQVGTADKKVEGTGLGLTLSRKFIELHDGRIWVKSEVGRGSTFTFTLPLILEDEHQTGASA